VRCSAHFFRRNDRRIRYLTNMFNSFFPSRSSGVKLNTTDHADESTLNKTVQSKLDDTPRPTDGKLMKTIIDDERFCPTPTLKHFNVNEKRENQEKQIFIENLKTCSSPYGSHRRRDSKFNVKEQLNDQTPVSNGNIYSEDPLSTRSLSMKPENNSLLYESVDIASDEPKIEEVIYDVINTTHEPILSTEIDDESLIYAVPKSDV
jgi:hypothetical protein